jgi:glycerol-3-phosphate dehydrogenase (NAD(P)+)
MNKNFDLENVLVLGAGPWGTAIATILACNITKVLLYTRDKSLSEEINNNNMSSKIFPNIALPTNIIATNDYTDTTDIDTIMIVVPVQSIDTMCKTLKKYANFRNIVVCSKGIDNTSLKLPSQICAKYFPNANIAALSGPNFAKEVVLKKLSKTLISSKNKLFGEHLQKIFKTDYFHPEVSYDIMGSEICSAVKNVIAIATGIAKGLELGENFNSALIVSALEEITMLVQKFGGKHNAVHSLAGIGDLLLTCYSLSSRNTNFGYNLVKKREFTSDYVTVEGYYTAKSIYSITKKLGIAMPICRYVYDVLYKGKDLLEITKVITPTSCNF